MEYDYTQYGPESTDSALGYRAGGYLNPRSLNVGFGIPVATPLAYIVKPENAGNLFSSAQSINSNGYMPLSGATSGTVENSQLTLDCPRGIYITSTSSAFSVIVSMYDQYNRKMVCEGSSSIFAGENVFEVARIPAAIVSVRFSGVNTGTFTANINTTFKFGLPFTNFGIPALLRTVNYDSNILFKPIIGGVTPYFAQYYPITSPDITTPQGANTGTSLPYIDLTIPLDNLTVDGSKYLVFEQALPIDQSIITPPFQEVQNEKVGYTLTEFIGVAPYNEKFGEWNG